MKATSRRWAFCWDIEKNYYALSLSCHSALKLRARESASVSAVLEEQPFHPERDQAERRPLTVMFCDLVDSTRLSRHLDPEDLQGVVRRFFNACNRAIGRFDGYIARYMGDGMR